MKIESKYFTWDKSRSIHQQKELTLLTALIFLEARGESHLGKAAVGFVVINRWRNKRRWPNTIDGVILQKYQFSPFNDFDGYKKALDPPPKVWEECFEVATQVYSEYIDDPTDGANHFYNPKLVKPTWARSMEEKATIGNHIFLKE